MKTCDRVYIIVNISTYYFSSHDLLFAFTTNVCIRANCIISKLTGKDYIQTQAYYGIYMERKLKTNSTHAQKLTVPRQWDPHEIMIYIRNGQPNK